MKSNGFPECHVVFVLFGFTAQNNALFSISVHYIGRGALESVCTTECTIQAAEGGLGSVRCGGCFCHVRV